MCDLCSLLIIIIITILLRYHADPSGTFVSWKAKAIGAGSEGAQTELQEKYSQELSLIDAETLALKVLKQTMEEKLNATNFQMAAVTLDKGFKLYSTDELKRVMESL